MVLGENQHLDVDKGDFWWSNLGNPALIGGGLEASVTK